MSYSIVKPTPPHTCCAMAVTYRGRSGRRRSSPSAPGARPAGRCACPGRLVDQRLAAVDGRRGVGQVVGDGLEGAEGLVELHAVLGVLHRDLERALRAAHGLGRQQDDAVVHDGVPGLPAGARRADADRGRTRARRRSSTWYCVSEARLFCWVSSIPLASADRRGRGRPRPRRCGPAPAGGWPELAKRTWRLVPVSREARRRPASARAARRAGP